MTHSLYQLLLACSYPLVRLRLKLRARREPAYLAGHRWSLARPAGDWRAGCAWGPATRLALCGDWCLGGRVEGAYLSGAAAAGRIAGAAVSPGDAPGG